MIVCDHKAVYFDNCPIINSILIVSSFVFFVYLCIHMLYKMSTRTQWLTAIRVHKGMAKFTQPENHVDPGLNIFMYCRSCEPVLKRPGWEMFH